MDSRVALQKGTVLRLTNRDGGAILYTIHSEIGRGSSCIVYDATYETNAGSTKHVRIKECYPYKLNISRNRSGELIPSADNVEFYHNVQKKVWDDFVISSKLFYSHKLADSFVNTFDIYNENNTTYIVSAFSPKDTLAVYKPVDIRACISLVRQVALAINDVHKEGYLYLDIKPENILAVQGHCDRVLLFDFDSMIPISATAEAKDGDGCDVRLSYTKGFAAVELQMAILNKLGTYTDVYGIGALLFYLLFGRAPIAPDCESDACIQAKDMLYDIKCYQDKLFFALNSFFQSTLASYYPERIQNMDAVIKLLDEILVLSDCAVPFIYSSRVEKPQRFFGREDALARIEDWLLSPQKCLNLYGMGGIGKSTLMCEVITSCKDCVDTVLYTEQVVFNTTQTRDTQRFDLAPGNYQVEFYSGNPDIAGSLFKYMFRFEIIDEKSAPYVNYYNLMSTERLEDLQSKHYEVAYQTTGGGYIFVCFSLESYDDAFEYAYEIEKRFVEKQEDGLYYKSLDNPSFKVKYFDYIELTAALNFYAKKNVEINYFNPLDAFTYQTYNNDLLSSLESLSLTDSIKVFPSQKEKDRLIKRRPYINNFQFINVADYDVTSVTAFCEKDNKTYNIEFNKPIEEQLHVSSKYTITETNIYGDSVSYDVYFINEIQTISHWTATQNGVESVIDVSVRDIKNGKMEITADCLVLKDITNALDTDAIVTIKAPDIYAFEIKCQISEMKGFTLYEAGVYELTFIDMLGNSYTLIATITGAQWQDVLAQNTTSYTSLYNAVYLNSTVENAEEWAYDDTAFSKTMLDISAIPHMLYTAETIQPLVEQYNIALSVSQNNPTQKEINAFNQQLVLLMSQLQLRENKQQLYDLLTHFTTLDFSGLSSSEATRYRETYEKACAVLYNLNATDAEISDATNTILSLQEKLTNPGLGWYWFVIIGVSTVGLIGGGVAFCIIRRKKK